MNLKNKFLWEEFVNSNQDNDKVKPVIRTSELIMRALDQLPKKVNNKIALAMLEDAARGAGIENVDTKLLNGVKAIIGQCHMRGEEFNNALN